MRRPCAIHNLFFILPLALECYLIVKGVFSEDSSLGFRIFSFVSTQAMAL